MKFHIYILYSKSIDRYYIGQTGNLDIRLINHQLKTTRYTKQADDWELIYTEEFTSRSEAMLREKFIKKQKSRRYIKNLIISTGPEKYSAKPN